MQDTDAAYEAAENPSGVKSSFTFLVQIGVRVGEERVMGLSTELEQIRTGTLGCEAIVFGDISAGIVLAAAASPGRRQEDHDALFAQAVQDLTGPGAALGSALSGSRLCATLMLSASGARLSVPAEAAGTDALCAATTLSSPLPTLVQQLRQVVDDAT